MHTFNLICFDSYRQTGTACEFIKNREYIAKTEDFKTYYSMSAKGNRIEIPLEDILGSFMFKHELLEKISSLVSYDDYELEKVHNPLVIDKNHNEKILDETYYCLKEI